MRITEAMDIKYDQRRAAVEAADARRLELHSLLPRVREIDAVIADLPLRVMNGGDIDALRAETERLNAERDRILASAGFDVDYDAPRFECPICRDSGYTDGLKICDCVKKLMASTRYTENSSLARGLAGKGFGDFSLDYYSANSADRGTMAEIFNACRKYAENFPPKNICGLLLTGGTGLGKTHLSAAIANQVSAGGYYTVYETAQQIFDTFDGVRFNKLPADEKDKYEKCELLLIDDLGSECKTNYSVATICNLIDLRMVNGRQTVISTNLTPQDIRKQYGERLFSRLMGEFKLLKFVGNDIRMQKITGGSH